ncbi:MAG: hypothetical protein ACXWAT_09960 [Methylobacter sp.]
MADGKIDFTAMSQEKWVNIAALNAALHINHRMLLRIKDNIAKMADDAGVLEIQHMTASCIDVEIRLQPEMAAGQCHLNCRVESLRR